MAKILHVVNSFDPSAAVVRSVRELSKHSHHEHRLFVKYEHPALQMNLEQAHQVGDEEYRRELLAWCDAIIYEFVGWERGFPSGPRPPVSLIDSPGKPAAFRNLNIYWNATTDKFWSHSVYNANGLERYSLVASSHVGAADFLVEPGGPPFYWLPDLLPSDGPYRSEWSDREPCISFIKHADEILQIPTDVKKLSLKDQPHKDVLLGRRASTAVIDNVCDGHWGLAGHESLLIGLPVVVFNHSKTIAALKDLTGTEGPFFQAKSVREAVHIAEDLARDSNIRKLQQDSRRWTEEYFDSTFLIRKTWDPFCDKLLIK